MCCVPDGRGGDVAVRVPLILVDVAPAEELRLEEESEWSDAMKSAALEAASRAPEVVAGSRPRSTELP